MKFIIPLAILIFLNGCTRLLEEGKPRFRDQYWGQEAFENSRGFGIVRRDLDGNPVLD